MLLFLDNVCFFFFFKQKTAYDMRISDWSSDVCSSDLCATARRDDQRRAMHAEQCRDPQTGRRLATACRQGRAVDSLAGAEDLAARRRVPSQAGAAAHPYQLNPAFPICCAEF